MVAHVAVLSDEWKELHVRVRLDQIISSPLEEREISLESRDAVALTVEAANVQGGWRLFISQDDAEFMIMEGSSAALFNHFITNNNE